MQSKDDQAKLFPIFYPYASQRYREIVQSGCRFVHYTSTELAMNIITHKEIWMRNATCMNDYMEIEYGIDCLKTARKSPAGIRFKEVLNGIFPDLYEEIIKLYDNWLFDFQKETYLTCVSEHCDGEDELGRLSMWRAYGKASGVALIINSRSLLSPSDALNTYINPVAYIDTTGVEAQISSITEHILGNGEFLKSLDRGLIKQYVFDVFKFATLCIKHPGFEEEREWRIVYSPTIKPSPYIKKDIHIFKGTPQPIYKIPLIDLPAKGYMGSIRNILDRIIIGPVSYPWVTYKAFVDILAEAGVSEPQNKVYLSKIPLRN